MKEKIVSPAEAAALVRSGDTVSISGFVGTGTPDELLIALAELPSEIAAPARGHPSANRRWRSSPKRI